MSETERGPLSKREKRQAKKAEGRLKDETPRKEKVPDPDPGPGLGPGSDPEPAKTTDTDPGLKAEPQDDDNPQDLVPVMEREPTEEGTGGGGSGCGWDEKPISEKQQIIEDMQKKLVIRRSSQFVPRPGTGTKGCRIALIANHFPLLFKNIQVFHYDVDIQAAKSGAGDEAAAPPELKKRFRKLTYKTNRTVIQTMFDTNKGVGEAFQGLKPVFDGQKSLYARDAVQGIGPKESKRFKVQITEEGTLSEYYVAVKFAAKIEMNSLTAYFNDKNNRTPFPYDAVQVLDIILRYVPTRVGIPIGPSLYSTDQKDRRDIGGGRELAFGHYQSARPASAGIHLVVDRTATAFFSAVSVETFIERYLSSITHRDKHLEMEARINDADRKQIERELKGLQVKINHLRYERKYRVLGLTRDPAASVTFPWVRRENGQEINMGLVTVRDYFRREYGKELRLPHMPCLKVGNPKRQIFLPLEVCSLVADQHVRRKLTPDQTAAMIKETGQQGPVERFDHIQRVVDSVEKDSRPYLLEFGISVSTSPVSLDGMKLDPPKLTFGTNKRGQTRTEFPENGKWDFREKTFNEPQALVNWICINHCSALEPKRRVDDDQAQALVKTLVRIAREKGMRASDPTKIANANYVKGCIPKIFEKAKVACPGLKMVFFLTPGDDEVYNEIKLVGDTQAGVVTQCINFKNAQRPNGSVLSNVLLKINAKLGGKASVLASNQTAYFRPEILDKNLMVVGADVTHPAPADKLSSSVAAVVASYDAQYCHYSANIKIQRKTRNEMIMDLDEMMVELLNDYSKHRKQLPDHIVFYRDGVSEGQFQQVLDNEIYLLHQSFEMVRPGYKPKVTFVVVQKRHHTRFRPQNPRDGVGGQRNIPPGTLVDNTVTHKQDFDFYLCSHFGMQGTSRPTHYYVLWDDNKFNADDLQIMTYYLCHVYARASKAVSIPAPVAYSHLAAYRARQWIIGSSEGSGSSSVSVFSESPEADRLEQEKEAVKVLNEKIQIHPDFRTNLFYC